MFNFYRRRKIRRNRTRTRSRRIRKSAQHKSNHPDYLANKTAAHRIIIERLEHFAAEYTRLDPTYVAVMKYRRVSIRNQRSRWGSCSAQKNLNFNYRLVHLSPELRDYVIVHELCHLVELNHGRAFWSLVEKMIPNAHALSHTIRRMPMDKVAGAVAVQRDALPMRSQNPVL